MTAVTAVVPKKVDRSEEGEEEVVVGWEGNVAELAAEAPDGEVEETPESPGWMDWASCDHLFRSKRKMLGGLSVYMYLDAD